MTDSNVIALNSSRERSASTMSGYLMLAVLLLSIVTQVWGIIQLANDQPSALALTAVILSPVVLIFVSCGFCGPS